MCGIFGAVVDRTNKRVRSKMGVLGAILAHSNDKRGGDSYGYYANKTLTKGLGKIASNKHEFINNFISTDVGIYHTRNATTGSVTVENAHPFEIGPIVGAHNGVVYNHFTLKSAHKREEVQVDSQHIFHHIAEGKDLKEIRAYGAIEYVYKDAPEEGVFLGKFNGGQLGIAATEAGIVWSSDKDDLGKAMKMANIKHKFFNILTDKLYQAYAGNLFTIGDLKFGEDYLTGQTYQNWAGWKNTNTQYSTTPPAPYRCDPKTGVWIPTDTWNKLYPEKAWKWNEEKLEWFQENTTETAQ